MPGAAYDAEVWLVRLPSGGAEETQKVTIHVTSDGQVFAFPPTAASSASGPVNIDIAVMLSPRLTEFGAPVLQVVVARGVSGSTSSLGGSMKVIPMPVAADIVSFEIPASYGGGQPISDDQYSVRIRLTPAKTAA
jgi:hypothetical protein